jgi:hypothetical protein
MFLLPMGILIIVDLILVIAVIIAKIQGRWRSKHPKASKNKGMPFGGVPFRSNKQYQELHDDSYPSAMESGIPMESRMDFRQDFKRRPSGFEQLGLQGAEFVLHDELNDTNRASRTDLQQFVQSLSRILGATKFGLSFEFQNLHFQPKKNPKPILSEVTGLIDAGSLWGVMGASGAGKCEFFLIWKLSWLIRPSNLCKRSHGQDITYGRCHQSQWGRWGYQEVCELTLSRKQCTNIYDQGTKRLSATSLKMTSSYQS